MASQRNNQLSGLKVAILATDGVEQSELLEPQKALEAAGAKTYVISPKEDKIQGWQHHEPDQAIDVHASLDEADPAEFSALLLPGGVMNPDQLRTDKKAISFIRHFEDEKKPIAAICHGPWTLIEADAVRGKKMTSWPSLKTDLRNAGAEWSDEKVIRDGNLVTSRKPDDLPDFNREMIQLFADAESTKHAEPKQASVAPSAQI